MNAPIHAFSPRVWRFVFRLIEEIGDPFPLNHERMEENSYGFQCEVLWIVGGHRKWVKVHPSKSATHYASQELAIEYLGWHLAKRYPGDIIALKRRPPYFVL